MILARGFKSRKLLIVILLVLLFGGVYAEKVHPKRSQKYFEEALINYRNYKFKIAESLLLKSILADTSNVNALLLLSDVSKELNNDDQLIWSLNKVIALQPDKYVSAYKFLADAYGKVGNYALAIANWKSYGALNGGRDSVLVKENVLQLQAALALKEQERSVVIKHLGQQVNTAYNEYWPLVGTNDSTLYFTRLITNKGAFAVERIYFSESDNDEWGEAQRLIISEGQSINEGTISMTADGGVIFFTACGRADGFGSCDLYYMLKTDGVWTPAKNAGKKINSRKWEAQPSVSAYGDKIYFTSNRPGGMGKNDIWMANVTRNNNELVFDAPINLGKGVNTAGNDFSPFIHADDQTLYFASDGRYNLGEHDLFISRLEEEGWGMAKNLGYPINSVHKEDGLAISASGKIAVFASNRNEATNGSMDLFQFDIPLDIAPAGVGYIRGKVYDENTHAPLNAEIEIQNLDERRKALTFSEKKSGYITTLKSNCNFALNVAKKGYLFYSKNINLRQSGALKDAIQCDIYLQPIQANGRLVLQNIFFEVDSFSLQPASYPELNTIVQFMRLNPTVQIEISGHTDNSGQKDYNIGLSKKRAEAIAAYLAQTIDKERIQTVGYGDKYPVASNDTESGRKQNRRSEMRILSN